MNSIKIGFASVILLACSICTSCKKERYAYYDGFRSYMNEEHNIDISKTYDNIYYILPLSDCPSCQGTLLNLELLSTLGLKQDNMTVILVGRTNDSTHKELIKKISSNITILKDSSNAIFSYQTGLGKPMLLEIKNGKVVHFREVTDFKIEEARKYLLK